MLGPEDRAVARLSVDNEEHTCCGDRKASDCTCFVPGPRLSCRSRRSGASDSSDR